MLYDAHATKHPLWETQVALEQGMSLEGARRVQDATVKAVEKRRLTTLKPYQELLQAWIPKVADKITEFTSGWAGRKGGVKPAALVPLQECDPFAAALIGLRSILDQLGTKHTEVTALAIRIGGAIEHELQVRLWERKAPALYRATRNRLVTQGADRAHTQRVNIHEFNRLLSQGAFGEGWSAWGQDLKLRVGSEVLNAIIHGTGWFDVVKGLMEHHPDQTHLALKPGISEWLANRLTKLEECSPALKPTIMPPKPWSGMGDGGYWTPYVPQQALIHFKAHQQQQREGARDEFDALEMPSVYRALNFLQETPWRINQRVLSTVNSLLAINLCGVAELPDYRGRELPVKPIDIDTNEEALKLWKREAAEVRGYNARLVSSQMQFNQMLGLATEFKGADRFYFPHKLDFRGRMYPIPAVLTPQGTDLSRGLLEFAEGKPVTAENQGDAWLAINLTSAWGNDKINFDERIAWVHSREDLWRRIAADPVGTRKEWIGEADKPWQFLAACIDWVGFLEEGFGYVSRAAVAVDGTCNGLQHLSALGRDAAVGERVNLVPGDKPSDVYQYVADALLPTLHRLRVSGGEPAEYASYWLTFCGPNGKLPRALAKRPVMILAYSATREAFKKYTLDFLRDSGAELPRQGDKAGWTLLYQRINFLVNIMWDAVQEAVPLPMRIMQWLKDCARAAAEGNQPIFWKTPDGFICRHFYGKLRSYTVRVKLDGSDFQLRLEEPTKDLDIEAQLRGISPNFVHSLDATAARGCINRAIDGGKITAFASVHDSFGTHAADMWTLYGCLREAFVEVHEDGVLENFRAMCQSVMVGHLVANKGMDPLEASQVADEKLPPMPDLGSLDIRCVLESDYFFA